MKTNSLVTSASANRLKIEFMYVMVFTR